MSKQILPPRLFFICCMAMIICSFLFPAGNYLPKPWNNLGFILFFIGLAMVRKIQGRFQTVGTEINTFKPPQKLVTSGLFTYSRNPIYLGFTIALVGVALVVGNLFAFDGLLAFIFAANFWYIPFEEAALEKQFGADYLAYKKKVRRWI